MTVQRDDAPRHDAACQYPEYPCDCERGAEPARCPTCGSDIKGARIYSENYCHHPWHEANARHSDPPAEPQPYCETCDTDDCECVKAILVPPAEQRAEDAERKCDRWQTVTDYARGKTGSGPGDLQTYIENLRSECGVLKAALRKYGRHSLECPRHHDFPGECTCGFDAALRSEKK